MVQGAEIGVVVMVAESGVDFEAGSMAPVTGTQGSVQES